MSWFITLAGEAECESSIKVVRRMEKYSTKELHEELAKREGVNEIVIGPHEPFKIVTDQGDYESTGPAHILINID